jgi:hypothetical protein
MSDPATEAQAEAQARAKMREMLLKGEPIKVDQTGKIMPVNAPNSQNAINVPAGELR